MGSSKTIIASLLAVMGVTAYAAQEWRLSQWRAAVADYEERIKVGNNLRGQNRLDTSDMPGSGTYHRGKRYDAMVRDRIIDYHSELQKLLEKKPSLFGLNERERALSVEVRVALGRFGKGSADMAEESSREYAALKEADKHARLHRAVNPEQMVFTSEPIPQPTPRPWKFIAPTPVPEPSREQVLSDIERKYGKPAPAPR